MARINLEGIVEDLSSQVRKALGAAVEEVLPEAEFDQNELFRAFKRAVRRKCSHWESVRDNHVDAE